jgi:hypothetical protein
MSVDIAIFAEKSKTYIYLDRSRYVLIYDVYTFDAVPRYQDIHTRFGRREWLSFEDMLFYFNTTPRVHGLDKDNPPESREQKCVEHWCGLAYRFVETRPDPDERFTMRLDNDDLHDFAEEGGYQEVDSDDPRKLYVEPPPAPDLRTPEQKAADAENAQKMVQELERALSAGYNLPHLCKGEALKIEPLDLSGITFSSTDLVSGRQVCGTLKLNAEGNYSLIDKTEVLTKPGELKLQKTPKKED